MRDASAIRRFVVHAVVFRRNAPHPDPLPRTGRGDRKLALSLGGEAARSAGEGSSALGTPISFSALSDSLALWERGGVRASFFSPACGGGRRGFFTAPNE